MLLVCREFCSLQTFKSRHVCVSIQKVTASSWGFCLHEQCLWVALEKKQTAQRLSPEIIQSLVQLSVPLWVDGSNYNEHFQAEENAALCCAVLLLFLFYYSQLPDCTENHSSTTTVPMATRGELHFISLFVTLPPSIPSLSPSPSHSLPATSFFISRCNLLLFSFLPVLVRGRTGSRGCSAFLNKHSTAIWLQAVIIIQILLYFWLNHAVSSVVLTAVWYICDTFVLCTSY